MAVVASAALAAPQPAGHSGATAQELDTRTHQALLGLYALDSRLQSWQNRLGSLQRAAAALRRERASLRQELGDAHTTLEAGQRQLAIHLRAMYEQGDVSTLAVMLGSGSVTKGLRRIDGMSRVADESRQIVASAKAAHARLLRSRTRLAVEGRRLDRSLAAARATARELAATVNARQAYIASLRAQERMQAAQVRSVEAQAQTAQQKSQALQPASSSTQTQAPPTGKRQLVVSATCYDLPGHTATGMPVGPGVVAVDPSVIPLGTRMYVPGYGNGVAADVGSGIKGASIDLWMTPSQCAAWGRRTVTITLD
jgi:3D (Asp-Asp-Asp) domain-containing protein